jgi:hypothetical protein
MDLKKYILTALLYFILVVLNAQNTPIEVVYQRYNNGEKDINYSHVLKFENNITYLSKNDDKIQEFIDYNKKVTIDIIGYQNKKYKTVSSFESLPIPTLSTETENILGFVCKTAVFKAFSNTIEVWYTSEAKAKGSPYKNYILDNSLVLKIVFNGDRKIIATKVQNSSEKNGLELPVDKAEKVSIAEFRELQIKSRYVTVPVFKNEQINFVGGLDRPNFDSINITYRCSKGTVILKKVSLPEMSKQGASVFATLTNWSNGDAYDRTCSLFTISNRKEKSVIDAFKNGIDDLPVLRDNNGEEYQGVVSTEDYDVPVELMRFFTSFGVSHFNKKREINNYKWKDSVVYKQEITSLIPTDDDEILVGVFIGNYDKGGHRVSLDLNFYPAWELGSRKEKWINPLFSTINILEMSGQNYGKMFKNDTLKTMFILPEKVKNLQLLYTTTGHGGWGGGDEFNPKMNSVFIDGKLVFSHVPWRTDCATYRMSNPASGNFKNGLSSSDLSRSNWCPATVTPPYFIPLDQLKPGKHTIEVVIDQGDDEGSSFNHWGVTGTLTGEFSN